MSKDILKDALEEVLSESYDEMTGLDIPDYDFSDNFKEKMEALTVVPEEKAEKKHRKNGWIVISALTAVAAAVCIWNGVQKTPELKRFNSDTDNIITDTELPTEVPDVPGGIVRTTAPGTDTKYTVTTTAGFGTPITSTAVINGNGNNGNNNANNSGNGGVVYTRPSGKPAQTPKVTVTTARSSDPAAVTTVTSATKQPVVTIVTTKPHSEFDEEVAHVERSIVMKKFLVSAAAAASFMNVVPTGLVQASYEPPTVDPVLLEYVFPSIEDGTASPDVNNDGIFDRYDVCDLWAYIMHNDSMITEAEKEVISTRSDIDLDLRTRANDLVILERYYLYKNGLDPEDFNMYNYPDNNGEITMDSYKFVNDLKEAAIQQDLIYQYTANLIETENIDLDFNRNGSADIYDLLEYQLYFYSNVSSPFDSSAAKALVPISSSTWDNCDEYYQKCFFDNESNETLVKYFIYKNGFDPTYIDTYGLHGYEEELYAALPEGTDVKAIRTNMAYVDQIGAFAGIVSKISLEAGLITEEDRSYKIDCMNEPDYDDKLNAACLEFDEKMLKGEVAPPDVNLDGTIDIQDYEDVITYSMDLVRKRNGYSSVLTPEVWYHIDTELDLNGDGVSGDMLDLQIVEFIVQKYNENEEVDINALLQAYNANKAKVETVAEISHIKYLEALNGKPIKRSGDADGDNQMKMNDAVLIMQSISNPDTYELTEWGEFNADVANTGDGITPMDALGIQYRLLEK